jgi:glycine/D-amino acid oxidase-like deaminating enzyme
MTTTYPLHDALTHADAAFPAEADVVIAGAGISGLRGRLLFALRGLKAVVLDKSRIAGQQSTRAWGFVRQQGRESAEVPLMMAGMRIWEGSSRRSASTSSGARAAACTWRTTKKTGRRSRRGSPSPASTGSIRAPSHARRSTGA